MLREILDGIAAKPGGDYIHSVCRHRQALPQSRAKYHGLPGPPLVRADQFNQFSGMKFFRSQQFFKFLEPALTSHHKTQHLQPKPQQQHTHSPQ